MDLSFLMCSERCGSNFITKIINAHSQICGPSTKHLINPVARNLFRYEPLTDKNHWHELLKDINTLLNVDFAVWKSEFNVQKLDKLAPVGDVAELIRQIFLEETKQQNKQHVFVKENQVYEFLPFLIWHFPESKYVYQVRDPRDMALSWKKSKPHPGGIINAARQWQKDQQKTLQNYWELKKQGKAILVKYEDLITNPEKQISRIVTFLGFDYEPEMMFFNEDEFTRQNAAQIKAWENLSKGIMSDNKKKYIGGLTDSEIAFVEKICRFEMKHLGYELENKLSELNMITSQKILDYSRYEEKTLKRNPSDGVLANMRAKKTMYTKVLK